MRRKDYYSWRSLYHRWFIWCSLWSDGKIWRY